MLKNQLEILEKSFAFFSKEKFNDVLTDKNTIITIQSKGKLNCYGWCTTQPAWYKGTYKEGENITEKTLTLGDNEIPTEEQFSEVYHELNFSAEYFNRNFYNTMETLLHEMVHLYNIFYGIEDCNKKQFHNEKFKAGCQRIGLIVDKIKTFGWANTYLSQELRTLIDEFVQKEDIDISVFNVARNDRDVKKVMRNNKKVKMICPCCDCVITSDEQVNIICKDCDTQFVLK